MSEQTDDDNKSGMIGTGDDDSDNEDNDNEDSEDDSDNEDQEIGDENFIDMDSDINSESEGGACQLQQKFVSMPSGLRTDVTKPAKPCCHSSCNFEANLILLRPENEIAQKEREIVVNEMNSTRVSTTHPSRAPDNIPTLTYDILTVHKIQNRCLWTKYRRRKLQIAHEAEANERMLFHGTMSSDNIIQTGFNLKLAKASGLYGAGLYFSDHSYKSNSYTFGAGRFLCAEHGVPSCVQCPRKMLLCRVTLGKMFHLETNIKLNAAPPGHHSVYGYLGPQKCYTEFVVYAEDQVYPEYLITYKVTPSSIN